MALDVAYTWGTTEAERALAFPGDRASDPGEIALWRGVTVHAPAPVMFRWLCQLRAAPYSYDWIDNGGRRSPRALIPGLEQLAVGQAVMIFLLESFEVPVQLTLVLPAGGRGERLFGPLRITYWVRPESADRARLLVKLRLAAPRTRIARLRATGLAWGDLVMMRRQLLNLKALAERHATATVHAS